MTMLQTFTNTRPYSQPRSPIVVEGDRYDLPLNFVEGLKALSPFVKRTGNPVETWVHLINGTLHVVTNSLLLEFIVGENTLPDLKFAPGAIRLLDAFGRAPKALHIDRHAFVFEWSDGQQLSFTANPALHTVWFGDHKPTSDARAATLGNYWQFGSGKPVSEANRKALRRSLSTSKIHKDVYLTPRGLISRMRSHKDADGYTSEHLNDSVANAARMMRFDRQAFLNMILVATEIDFNSSPVCFRHENGRGLLIERTLGSDTPDVEVWDD